MSLKKIMQKIEKGLGIDRRGCSLEEGLNLLRNAGINLKDLPDKVKEVLSNSEYEENYILRFSRLDINYNKGRVDGEISLQYMPSCQRCGIWKHDKPQTYPIEYKIQKDN